MVQRQSTGPLNSPDHSILLLQDILLRRRDWCISLSSRMIWARALVKKKKSKPALTDGGARVSLQWPQSLLCLFSSSCISLQQYVFSLQQQLLLCLYSSSLLCLYSSSNNISLYYLSSIIRSKLCVSMCTLIRLLNPSLDPLLVSKRHASLYFSTCMPDVAPSASVFVLLYQ